MSEDTSDLGLADDAGDPGAQATTLQEKLDVALERIDALEQRPVGSQDPLDRDLANDTATIALTLPELDQKIVALDDRIHAYPTHPDNAKWVQQALRYRQHRQRRKEWLPT